MSLKVHDLVVLVISTHRVYRYVYFDSERYMQVSSVVRDRGAIANVVTKSTTTKKGNAYL